MSGSLQKVPGGGGWWVVVESKFSVQLRPKLNIMQRNTEIEVYKIIQILGYWDLAI